jgi:transketolase
MLLNGIQKNMNPHDSMRGHFAYELWRAMQEDEDIWVLTADLGYGMFDHIRDDFNHRFLNVGASEQMMLDMAVGLALSGKKPFVYSITPFLIYRAFETLRTYISYERIPVRLIGSGRDKDYKHDGISHWAEDVVQILRQLPNLSVYLPETNKGAQQVVKRMVAIAEPQILLLRR